MRSTTCKEINNKIISLLTIIWPSFSKKEIIVGIHDFEIYLFDALVTFATLLYGSDVSYIARSESLTSSPGCIIYLLIGKFAVAAGFRLFNEVASRRI